MKPTSGEWYIVYLLTVFSVTIFFSLYVMSST